MDCRVSIGRRRRVPINKASHVEEEPFGNRSYPPSHMGAHVGMGGMLRQSTDPSCVIGRRIRQTCCSATYLDDAADGAAGSLQDVLEALAAGRRLIGNGAFDQLARGIRGNLAAYEDMGAGLDCLRLYCERVLVSGLNFPARGQSRGARAE